ncbi:M61 family metallopeptidase [Novosphingobium rosa]|uniref:M61 family metallopeptidase n=1 Tax=Novosphingobium rosa TaxID=76978 RepID=UPI000834602F|nr:hypothetical protein [Novosphingobium rosa]
MTLQHHYSGPMRAVILGFTLLVPGAASPKVHPEPLHYTLAPEMSGDTVAALRVSVQFQAEPSGTTDMGWDEGWAGENKLWQWARDFKVAGASAVEVAGNGHWHIKAAPGAKLTATYRIVSGYDHDPRVEDSEQPRPVIRPRWFYAAGNALFAYPAHRENAPATFDWVNTPGVGFASDLEHLAGQARKALRPGTVADVLESIVIGGQDLRVFPATDGSGVRVASVGSYAFTPEQMNNLTRRVIDVERSFWKADRRAPFLVTTAPITSTPTLTGFSGTGRGDAFALWIDERTPLDRTAWLLAHEYFHTWNPALLGSMSQDRAARPEQYWFSEGFTDYYARALMVRSGIISPAQFAAEWNEMLASYAGSPVKTMPGKQAAATFWNSDAAQKLPYQRGAMLAAMWNRRLLAASKGASNLDTILVSQMRLARTAPGAATSLFRSLAQRRGLNVGPDEERFLARGQPILLPANTFGPCATVVTAQRPSFSRGFDTEATAASGNLARGVDPSLPAYAAGLRDGMKILAHIEGEPDNALIPYVLLVEDHGAQRKIRYLPQGHGQTVVQELQVREATTPICSRTLGGL